MLAHSCLEISDEDSKTKDLVNGFIGVYQDMMTRRKYERIFGLRDIIHFFTYLRRQQPISPESVTMALERNFNGTDFMKVIIAAFLKVVCLVHRVHVCVCVWGGGVCV